MESHVIKPRSLAGEFHRLDLVIFAPGFAKHPSFGGSTRHKLREELSARFGLNEFKLKKGYKHFFQSTVFSDIHRLRMQHARQLLTERVMNVTEAAYYIGYSDLSSFSYAFKKRFGYNPGRV